MMPQVGDRIFRWSGGGPPHVRSLLDRGTIAAIDYDRRDRDIVPVYIIDWDRTPLEHPNRYAEDFFEGGVFEVMSVVDRIGELA